MDQTVHWKNSEADCGVIFKINKINNVMFKHNSYPT